MIYYNILSPTASSISPFHAPYQITLKADSGDATHSISVKSPKNTFAEKIELRALP